MTYITWKERQTNCSMFEKTLSLKSEKYRSAKKRVFEQILQSTHGNNQCKNNCNRYLKGDHRLCSFLIIRLTETELLIKNKASLFTHMPIQR